MRLGNLVLLVLVLDLTLVGCASSPAENTTFEFAVVAPSSFYTFDPSVFEWDPPDEEKSGEAPSVTVESFVTSVEPRFLRELGLTEDRPFRKLAASERERVVANPSLASPNMKAFSGQTAHTLVVSESSYIRDVSVESKRDGRAGYVLSPTIGVLKTGTVVKARPQVSGREVELHDIDLQNVRLLGMRSCVARFPGVPEEVVWEEPSVLVARSIVPSARSVRLKEGDSVLFRLRYEVKQASANARGFAVGGRVTEHYRSGEMPADSHTSPLSRECVALLTVTKVNAELARN